MKISTLISRIFAGCLFVFSGFVKAVDPMGSAIKFGEYFDVFHLGFLSFLAMPLAIGLSAAELMIGLNLLTRVRFRFTAWLLVIFMSFFTLLTFVLAVGNPVSDCGCFGDALKLTNWQTFFKNIVLFIPTVIIFLNRDKQAGKTTFSNDWWLVAFHFLVGCGISGYGLRHEPLLDFRPYRIGTYIPDKMVIPQGAPVAQYKTILTYRKNGVTKEFTEQNYPWQDTTWKWVATRQKLIRKGYEPPIHDFSITNQQGQDITDSVLSDTSYLFLIISPMLDKASPGGLKQMTELARSCHKLGIPIHGLTASPDGMIKSFISSHRPGYDFWTADETTLKTMIRANPGVILLNRGTLVGKWNYRDAPGPGKINSHMLSVALEKQFGNTERLRVYALLFFLALIDILYVNLLCKCNARPADP